MKKLLSEHLYKLIYLLMALAVVLSVLSFENRIKTERKLCSYTTANTKGTVKKIYSKSAEKVCFTIKAQDSSLTDKLLYVELSNGDLLDLAPGDKIELSGTVSPPEKALNYGAFDYADYVKAKGASLVLSSDISYVKHRKKGIWHSLYSARDRISDKISEYISTNEAGLVNAIVTGSKDKISDDFVYTYRKAGIYHIVAVSGMHLNILILILSFIYLNFPLSKRKKSFTALGITIAGCGFMFAFTGFGVSVLRAAIMAILVCASRLFYREYSPFTALFAAFSLIALTEPYNVYDASFCLSFSATFGILMGVCVARKINFGKFKFIGESVTISICINLATLPFTVIFFGATSLVSIISNLVVLSFVPLLLSFSYLFAAVCLVCGDGICTLFANMVSPIAYCINLIGTLFSKIPFSYVTTSLSDVGIVYGCAALTVLFVKLKNRYIRIAITSIIIIANIFALSYNKIVPSATVTFLNALQGECSVIHDANRTAVMIDCGTESMTGFGTYQAKKYMDKAGISKLDMLIITHYHIDHTSGVAELLEEKCVKKLAVPDRQLFDDEKEIAKQIHHLAVLNNIPIVRVKGGDVLSVGEHKFEILSPNALACKDANNASIAIKYSFQKKSVLFCADIEEMGQYSILESDLKSDIIKVPHHGASSSMGFDFAKKADADYAVISCKKGNKYHHPAEDTLLAYKDCSILRTDEENYTISFVIKQNKIRRKAYAQY